MDRTAKIELDGTTYEFPVVEGTEHELAIDISALRAKTGYITLDDGYGNTGSCRSAITYIDGDAGILRHRGIPIEVLAEKSSFVEAAWLIIFGKLPTIEERAQFSAKLRENARLDEATLKHFDGFPAHGNPMGILSAMVNTIGLHNTHLWKITDDEHVESAAACLMSQVRTIAAAAYKNSVGEPMIYPRYDINYVDNFLHMMFSLPYKDYEPTRTQSHALNLFFLLHADHEQNCSTSTVRMVASSQANVFASCSAGVSALWGPLHGGANVAVIEMLQQIRDSGMDVKEFVRKVKNKEDGVKLMGFGHRVYRNFDPRSKILKAAADDLLNEMHITDPLLDLGQELADVALNDEYFIERKLYPNVDFYSGTILRACGIPVDMFTVMFAIGRMPGWVANWKEIHDDSSARIYRPRQVYVGPTDVEFVLRDRR